MLQINNLNKTFYKKEILTDLTYTFEKGHIYSILGGNGSGRTTLFQCISQDLSCTKGNIIIEGGDNDHVMLAHKRGLVPSYLTGYQFLKFLKNDPIILTKKIKPEKALKAPKTKLDTKIEGESGTETEGNPRTETGLDIDINSESEVNSESEFNIEADNKTVQDNEDMQADNLTSENIKELDDNLELDFDNNDNLDSEGNDNLDSDGDDDLDIYSDTDIDLDSDTDIDLDFDTDIDTDNFNSDDSYVDNSEPDEIDQILAQVNFDNREKHMLIKDYNFKTKTKLQLAACLVKNPYVMLFDEPIDYCDETFVEEFIGVLESVKKDHIILVSTGQLEAAKAIPGDILVLNNGELNIVDRQSLENEEIERAVLELLEEDEEDE